jgi:hypothetical protein
MEIISSNRNNVDPFMMLLQHLNPFIDESPSQREFHRFLDLPLELRYKVYEQHFLDNTKSTCTAYRPTLSMNDPAMLRNYKRQVLPDLCCVSKLLREELLKCLLDRMEVKLRDLFHLKLYAGRLSSGKMFESFDLFARFRTVTFRGLNSEIVLCLYASWEFGIIEANNTTVTRLLPTFAGIRHLSVVLTSPLHLRDHADHITYKTLSITNCLQGLDTASIVGLKELRKLTITGTTGFASLGNPGRLQTPIEDDENIEHLRSVSELAQQIKDGLKEHGRDVRVEVYLKYGKDLEEYSVLS